MTDAQINQAIAEACGWLQIEDVGQPLMLGPGIVLRGYPPRGAIVGKKCELPDYVNDLNAMHEAESTLGEKDCFYTMQLALLVKSEWLPMTGFAAYRLATATARQRAEAFLAAIASKEVAL